MNLLYLLRKIYCQLTNREIPKSTIIAIEPPERLEKDAIYLIGNTGYMWLAEMLCPCGCGTEIKLNLLSDVHPCWNVKKHLDSTISLIPSVDRIYGCKSHFWVQKGLIKWVPLRHM